MLVKVLGYLIVGVSVLNLARGLYLVLKAQNVLDSWCRVDCWLATVSGLLLLTILIFHESDIRSELQIAQHIDPLSQDKP